MAKVKEREPEAPPRGVYAVRLDGCPRKLIDTGMPAGPAAEAVARDRYLHWLNLTQRPGLNVEVKLDAEKADAGA
jgi:hypothetical protein